MLSDIFEATVKTERFPQDMFVNFTKDKKDTFDSDDERYMFWWLMAAMRANLVSSFTQPKSIFLLPSIKAKTERPAKRGNRVITKQFSLSNRSISYTPDFVIEFDAFWVQERPELFNVMVLEENMDPIDAETMEVPEFWPKAVLMPNGYNKNAFFNVHETAHNTYRAMIDIKPEVKFARFGASHRDFPIKQAILWNVHWIYVQEFVLLRKKVPELFLSTFTPARFLNCNKEATRPRKLHFNPQVIKP